MVRHSAEEKWSILHRNSERYNAATKVNWQNIAITDRILFLTQNQTGDGFPSPAPHCFVITDS